MLLHHCSDAPEITSVRKLTGAAFVCTSHYECVCVCLQVGMLGIYLLFTMSGKFLCTVLGGMSLHKCDGASSTSSDRGSTMKIKATIHKKHGIISIQTKRDACYL